MPGKFEKATAREKISAYVESRRTIMFSVLIAVVAVIAVYSIAVTVMTKSNEKDLSKIDAVTYQLTKDSFSLSEEELDVRRETAMTALTEFVKKGGIVGVRANMLAAEICYSQKKYDEASAYWTSAAEKSRSSYTAPIAYFNAAVCSEEIGNLDSAENFYEKASKAPDFLQANHAEFSLGRVREAKGDFAGAAEAYKSLFDKSPNDSWGMLARTRFITLQTEGKIE